MLDEEALQQRPDHGGGFIASLQKAFGRALCRDALKVLSEKGAALA